MRIKQFFTIALVTIGVIVLIIGATLAVMVIAIVFLAYTT